MTFEENDSIYKKTISPIVGGDLKRGWLFYQITNATFQQLIKTNVQWVVSFDDVTGKRYFVTNDNARLSGGGGGGGGGYFPGSEVSF
jgi:hypothetical protein